MMCCALAALLMTGIAALRGLVKPTLAILLRTRWVVASLVAALVLAGGSALMARQLDHAPRQTDFSTFLMQHICGFAAQGEDAAPGRGNTKR
jgi:hypothetical protein